MERGVEHRYVSAEMAKLLDKPVEDTKIVTCHIGNGSSISAVKGGKVLDTTMGFTPLAGVEMGTRCGDIDPAIVPYLMDKEGLSASQVNDIMNKKSGFLGITGYSSDSRDIENAILAGPSDKNYEKCLLAVSILKHQLKKCIGSYAAIMNGLDAVVFTAGIGENNKTLRQNVCRDMSYLGIEIDEELNMNGPRGEILEITAPGAKVRTFVIPTNEEYMIALDTLALATK